MNVFGIDIETMTVTIAMLVVIILTVIATLFIVKKINLSINIKSFWSFMKDGLSEDNGHASSTRINQLFANALFSPAIAYGFLYVLWYHEEYILLYLAAMLAAMGLTQGLKVISKKNEQPMDAPTSTSSATAEVKQ
jgi:hypothetical protein